ncbi:MAG: hypothetical protein ABI618_20470, partial [Nitrospirota bacterium]
GQAGRHWFWLLLPKQKWLGYRPETRQSNHFNENKVVFEHVGISLEGRKLHEKSPHPFKAPLPFSLTPAVRPYGRTLFKHWRALFERSELVRSPISRVRLI